MSKISRKKSNLHKQQYKKGNEEGEKLPICENMKKKYNNAKEQNKKLRTECDGLLFQVKLLREEVKQHELYTSSITQQINDKKSDQLCSHSNDVDHCSSLEHNKDGYCSISETASASAASLDDVNIASCALKIQSFTL